MRGRLVRRRVAVAEPLARRRDRGIAERLSVVVGFAFVALAGAAARAEGAAVAITAPVAGTTVRGPVRISGTYRGTRDAVIAIDAGIFRDVHLGDPDGEGAGTWYLDWDPTGERGDVEIIARATAIDDRTARWARPVRVTVDVPGRSTPIPAKGSETGTGAPSTPLRPSPGRSIWVWESAAAQLLESAGAREVLASFMDDPGPSSRPLRTIYLYSDRLDGAYPLVDHPERYRTFNAWAHARGYAVHALVGSGLYAAPMLAYARFHAKAESLMQSVLDFNRAADAEERFDGVNIDIEPYVLPEWHDAPVVPRQYLEMLDKMMRRKAASGQRLAVGAVVPRWFDSSVECKSVLWRGKRKSCASHAQDVTDYVALMDYRDEAGGPAGIVEGASGEIDYGDSIGKPVVIGIETGTTSASGDPETISFREEGREFMEQELARVEAAFRGHRSFAGIAIDHYDAYRELPSAWRRCGSRWRLPLPDLAPPSRPAHPTSTPWDAHRIDLRWDASIDDRLVDHYEIHRGESAGFAPSAATLVGSTPLTRAKDAGLLPAMTYFYRVVAVDAAGKSSPPSDTVSATTLSGSALEPMSIGAIACAAGPTGLACSVRIVDASGHPVAGARVLGAFGGAAGRKFDGRTGSDGTIGAVSETLRSPYVASFVPDAIDSKGRYWASSLDVAHRAQGAHGDEACPAIP